MADKVQKIREEVERLRSLHQIKYQHLDTNDNMCLVECSMRNLCNDLLLFIDSLQEEPVSKDLHHIVDTKAKELWDEMNTGHEYSILDSYNQFLGICMEIAESIKEEPVSKDLEEASKEWLKPQLDKSYANYGETKMMELTHFDGYAMLDAIEFGAQWQQEKDSIPAEYLEELINKLSKQFPEVSFAKLSRIAVRVAKWQQNQDVKNKLPKVTNKTYLDEYAYQCAYDMSNDWAIDNPTWHDVEDACKLGAKWQENHLWKSADGDDLPEYDREVIVLTQPYPLEGSEFAVSFAHRPNKYANVWNSDLGEEQVVEIERHGKGGWNIPDVKYWLDVDLPNFEEDKE